MNVKVSESRAELGVLAAADGLAVLRSELASHRDINMVVATGTSQFEVLSELTRASDIDWPRITIFHLDEYVGLPESHPASFRKYLRERFINLLPAPPRAFHAINGEGDAATEIARLNGLITGLWISVAFIGIGENGHIAFNDPPADFETQDPYILVHLDNACRRQQLGEGWFPTLESVPGRAISMSVRQIMRAKHIVCCVPDLRKARPVRDSVEGPVTPEVPASILQQHTSLALYLDKPSASMLNRQPGRISA